MKGSLHWDSYERSYLVEENYTSGSYWDALYLWMLAFFAAACMTLDLVESCKHFISAVINGSDLVLHFQLPLLMIFTLRCWNLLGSRINVFMLYHPLLNSGLSNGSQPGHSTFVVKWLEGSGWADQSPHCCLLLCCCPGISSAIIVSVKAGVAGAIALLQPISSSTQVTCLCFVHWLSRDL